MYQEDNIFYHYDIDKEYILGYIYFVSVLYSNLLIILY